MKRLANTLLLIILINLLLLAQPPQTRPVSSQGRSANQRYFSPFKPKRTKEQAQMLLPNSIDTANYADFLRHPGTGLMRLYPDLDCESTYILRVDQGCANNIPGASNYSFRTKDYTSDFLADIRFKNRFFVSDGVLTQSFIVNLGNVALENISLSSSGMKYLTDFQPATENSESLQQYQQLSRGIKVDKYEYRKITIAAENTTYAMRVVAYRAAIYRNYRGWLYNVLDGDKRNDLIVVFRVIRHDQDGSMTLLWKELDRKKSVKIRISKSDKK